MHISKVEQTGIVWAKIKFCTREHCSPLGSLLKFIAMISGIIAGVGALASLGSGIAGAIGASRRAKEAQKLLDRQSADNKRWYNIKMSQDYTQRAGAQNILRKQREMLNEQYQSSAARNIVSGGTDEQLALQQQAANKSMADTTADIAAAAEAHKDAAEQQYRATEDRINQQKVAVKNGQAAAVSQAAGQAVQAGINLVGAGVSMTQGAKAPYTPQANPGTPLEAPAPTINTGENQFAQNAAANAAKLMSPEELLNQRNINKAKV